MNDNTERAARTIAARYLHGARLYRARTEQRAVGAEVVIAWAESSANRAITRAQAAVRRGGSTYPPTPQLLRARELLAERRKRALHASVEG
jgi:hypothetical protein